VSLEVPTLYCPAGARRRLPSVLKVRRRKNESSASLWYSDIDLVDGCGFGEDDGFTAGSGRAGEGDAERLKADMDDCAGDPQTEDLLLVGYVGGFIGMDRDVGVPGVEEVGEGAIAS